MLQKYTISIFGAYILIKRVPKNIVYNKIKNFSDYLDKPKNDIYVSTSF
jgi:hypothetical protein